MPRPGNIAATLRLHPRFYSRGLRNHRDVIVWLPPGYSLARRRHPVIYFQDGQNIFDPQTAFLGNAWHAGERATELIRAHRIAAPIMVGVYNTGFNRMNEYAPTPAEFSGWDGEKCRSTGDAKRYARFLVNELKPFIDARYLTLPGPRHTALVGSSMGGLVSLCFALWHPRVFGQIAALSPSVWWDHRAVIREFARLRKKPGVRLWLDLGTAEPGGEDIRLLRDTLVGRGWREGGDLHYHEVAGAEHTEAAWSARLGDVLQWLVGRGTGINRG
jgi:predicted alpha/beta superfamily hydrolase